MKTLKISEETHSLLMIIKASEGYKTLDQTIKELIDDHKAYNFTMAVLNNDK